MMTFIPLYGDSCCLQTRPLLGVFAFTAPFSWNAFPQDPHSSSLSLPSSSQLKCHLLQEALLAPPLWINPWNLFHHPVVGSLCPHHYWGCVCCFSCLSFPTEVSVPLGIFRSVPLLYPQHPIWNDWRMKLRDFPDGPVVKIPHSLCWGPSSIPGQGTRSHMSQLKTQHTY